MLFCFGLFALPLYYTVVANAECSYTYRSNSSRHHIEASSRELELQGFRRCEFLIQLGEAGQWVQLNFTTLRGFGMLTHAPQKGNKAEVERGGDARGDGDGAASRRSGGEDGYGAGGARDKETLFKAGGGDEGEGDSGLGAVTPPGGHAGPAEPGKAAFSALASSSSSSSYSSSSYSSSSSSSTTPSSASSSEPSKKAVERWNSTAGAGGVDAEHEVVAGASRVFPPTSSPPSPVSASSRQTMAAHPGWPGWKGGPDSRCLPVVEIREVLGQGREEVRHRLCQPHDKTHTPLVFRYSSSVRIVFEWERRRTSAFTLYLDFRTGRADGCVHACDGGRCLRNVGLLCDGHAHCRDESDEAASVCFLTNSSSSALPIDPGSLVTVVLIPSGLALGLVLALVTSCTVCRRHCRSLSASINHRAHGHAAHLTSCPQSRSTEGLTPSGCSTHDCSEQAVALLPSARPTPNSSSARHSWPHHHHHHPHPHPAPSSPCVRHQAERDGRVGGGRTGAVLGAGLGLPVSVSVSPDGEEGYASSQQRLTQCRLVSDTLDLHAPPPNRTVYDRDSPPPYSLLAATPHPRSAGPSPVHPGAEAEGRAGRGADNVQVGDYGCVRVVRDWRRPPGVGRYSAVTPPYSFSLPSPLPHPRRPHLRPTAPHAASPLATPTPAPYLLQAEGPDALSSSNGSGGDVHALSSNTDSCSDVRALCRQPLPIHVHGAFCTPSPTPPAAPAPPSGTPGLPRSPLARLPRVVSAGSDRDAGVGGARERSAWDTGVTLDSGHDDDDDEAPPSYEVALTLRGEEAGERGSGETVGGWSPVPPTRAVVTATAPAYTHPLPSGSAPALGYNHPLPSVPAPALASGVKCSLS